MFEQSKKKHILIKSTWEAQVSFGFYWVKELIHQDNETWGKIYVMEEVTL